MWPPWNELSAGESGEIPKPARSTPGILILKYCEKERESYERETKSGSKTQKIRVKVQNAEGKVQKAKPIMKLSSQEKWEKFGSINVPRIERFPWRHHAAPVKQQELFMTSNWRIVRPVIDHEKCTRCFTCYITVPTPVVLR